MASLRPATYFHGAHVRRLSWSVAGLWLVCGWSVAVCFIEPRGSFAQCSPHGEFTSLSPARAPGVCGAAAVGLPCVCAAADCHAMRLCRLYALNGRHSALYCACTRVVNADQNDVNQMFRVWGLF